MHAPAVQPFVSENLFECSLSIAQQLRSLVSHRKMKPICLSVDVVLRSTLFFFFTSL